MTHYYTDNSMLKSEKKEFKYTFDNEEFIFTSDHGFFSKDSVDYGSYLLIKCVYQLSLGENILDLGCGYGVVVIILARFHKYSTIDLVDVNSRAIELSRLNALKNNVSINLYQTDDISTINRQYDSIILNPPIRAGKVVIFGLYEKAYQCLKDGGHLYIVILKKHGAKSSLNKLKELFNEVKVLDRIDQHWLIEATK